MEKETYSLPSFIKESGNENLQLPSPSVFSKYYSDQNRFFDNSSSPFLTLGNELDFKNNTNSESSLKHKSWGNVRKTQFIGKRNNFENNSFCCDACGKSYPDQSKLNEHLSEHIKCDFGGCSFEAHPKIVELHIKLQHYTGLALKIMKLDTPEEIKRWREERRKNFPTAANIKKHKEEQAEKAARGELVESKSFGKIKSYGKNFKYNSYKKQKYYKRKRRSKFNKANNNTSVQQNFNNSQNFKLNTLASDINDSKDKLQFTGIPIINGTENKETNCLFNKSELLSTKNNQVNDNDDSSLKADYHDTSDFSISDSDTEFISESSFAKHDKTLINNNFQQNSNNELLVTSSFKNYSQNSDNTQNADESKLQLSYFVADEIIEDSDNEKPIVQKISYKSEDHLVQNKIGGALGSLMDNYGSDSDNEEKDDQSKPIKIEKKNLNNSPINKKKYEHQFSHRHQKINKLRFRSSYTLLEKLLANEIKSERNKIMQCVHYIVKNKFFDICNLH